MTVTADGADSVGGVIESLDDSRRCRCDAKFMSFTPTLQDFVVMWRMVVEICASAPQTSFIRQEAQHLCSCLERFI